MAEFDREQIIDKINKLLKQSESPYPEEAQTSLLMAQKLLLRYKIDERELTKEEASKLKIVDAQSGIPANTMWARDLVRIFSKNFGTMVFYRKFKNSTYPVFFGEEEKALICKDLYEHTVIWLNKRACAYATKMRNTRGIVKGVKQDFIVGFLSGLRDKFEEQVNQDSNMYALVVMVDPQVKSAFDRIQLGGTLKSKSMTVHGLDEARAAGYREGKNFNVERQQRIGD